MTDATHYYQALVIHCESGRTHWSHAKCSLEDVDKTLKRYYRKTYDVLIYKFQEGNEFEVQETSRTYRVPVDGDVRNLKLVKAYEHYTPRKDPPLDYLIPIYKENENA